MRKNGLPTYEGLSAMYAESFSWVAFLEKEAKSLRARNASLEGDVGRLAEALAAVSSELGDKETIIKILNCDRFYSKRDSVYKDAARAAERASKGKAAGSKRGRKRGTPKANKAHAGELEAAIAEDLRTEPHKSPLWCAASYSSSMRGELLTFMSDGRASAEGNAAERCRKV